MSAEGDLARFIAKFAPDMRGRIRGCRAVMHARFPFFLQRGPELPTRQTSFAATARPSAALRSTRQPPFKRTDVAAIIEAALRLAIRPMHPSDGPQLVIKSVSARQRPRQ
jgi:hypothetical protein